MKVLEFPLSKISIVFVIGVLTASFATLPISIIITSLLVTFFCFVFIYFYAKTKEKVNSYFGFFAYLLNFLIGYSTLLLHDETQVKNHFVHQIDELNENQSIEFTVVETLKSSKKNKRYIVSISKLGKKNSHGKALLNVKKTEETNTSITVGRKGLVYGSIIKHRKPNNPLQFDYGKYLENKQIYGQIYSNSAQIRWTKMHHQNIPFYAAKFRDKVNATLKSNNFDKDALAILNALVLGQRQEISTEVLRDYQYAGAVHILAVSGLHVGLLLLFVNLLLQPLPNSKRIKLIKLVVTLSILWSFGFVAGLSPSILRSVVMFSIVAIGMYWQRGTNIYYTLLISMLLILFFSPNMLFDVGFQLSYIAVFSIVWIQPIIKKMWQPKNKFINYFWEILTVSIAAQLGTFPISIYYFHQFPGLFFITNLIIIPSLTIILGLGIIVVLLASLDFVPRYPALILEKCIELMNLIINKIATVEAFIIKDIPMNQLTMMSLYLFLIFLIQWIKTPRFKNLVMLFCAIFLLQSAAISTKYNTESGREIIVFNAPKSSLMVTRTGKHVAIYANDSILRNVDNDLNLKSYVIGHNIQTQTKITISNLMYFEGKKVVIIDSSSVYPKNCKPDLVLIRQAPRLNMERLLDICQPKAVVCDASNYKTYVSRWKTTCLKRKIPFHSTYEKGFYVLKID